jgi:hypothetical protein
MPTGKSVLIAGVFGAIIFVVFGNMISNIGQQVFPSNPMLATAATGFGIGAGIQLAVRLTGVS